MALRVFIIVCGAVVALALGVELLVPGYRPSLLIEQMLSRQIPQQTIVIVCGVLLLLLAGVALLLISQRKATEKLEMRLRGVGHAVYGLGEAQKDSDEAAAYLDRTDPEGAISTLQGPITKANEAADLHHARNVALDLNSQVEQLRQQQFLLRENLAHGKGRQPRPDQQAAGRAGRRAGGAVLQARHHEQGYLRAVRQAELCAERAARPGAGRPAHLQQRLAFPVARRRMVGQRSP